MKDEKYWYELDLASPLAEFGRICDQREVGTNPGISYIPCNDILPNHFLETYRSLGIHLGNSMVFYRPAWMSNEFAHVDLMTKMPDKSVVCSINMVYMGNGSEMVWYDMPDRDRDLKWTPAGTPYLSWPVKDLNEKDRACINGRMTLVRVDVPHAIFVKEEPRWCLSLRFSTPFLSWDDAVDFFAKSNLLIPR